MHPYQNITCVCEQLNWTELQIHESVCIRKCVYFSVLMTSGVHLGTALAFQWKTADTWSLVGWLCSGRHQESTEFILSVSWFTGVFSSNEWRIKHSYLPRIPHLEQCLFFKEQPSLKPSTTQPQPLCSLAWGPGGAFFPFSDNWTQLCVQRRETWR